MWISTVSKPASILRRVAAVNCSTTASISASFISCGTGCSESNGTALGAIGCHPPLLSPTPPPGRHGVPLDPAQPRPAHRPAAQVHEVPVGRHAVVAGILAHGRNPHAIAEFELAKTKGSEEVAHGQR